MSRKVWLVKGEGKLGPKTFCTGSNRVEIRHNGLDGCWLSLETLEALGFTVQPFEEPRREFWIAPRPQPASETREKHYIAFDTKALWGCDPIHVVEINPG